MNKQAILFLLFMFAAFGIGVFVGRVITYPEAVFLALDLCTEG